MIKYAPVIDGPAMGRVWPVSTRSYNIFVFPLKGGGDVELLTTVKRWHGHRLSPSVGVLILRSTTCG